MVGIESGGGGGGTEVGSSKAPGIFGLEIGLSEAGIGVEGLLVDSLSIALKGRGGAIVPKRMLASCLALPPPRGSSSSSSDSLSESAPDQSSSSGRRRDPPPVIAGVRGLAAVSCWAMRWNGFVDSFAAGGENT